MALIGYARVSTQKQDLTDQIEQLQAAGCEKIFEGKNSGKKESNAARLAELLAYIREGDIVVVTKLDRLGRSLAQVLGVLDELKVRNIAFKTLDGAIDTSKRNDPIATATIQLLGLFSELERNFIVTRTQEGKITKGRVGGRRHALSNDDLKTFKKDMDAGKSILDLAEKYKISVSTVLRAKLRVKELYADKPCKKQVNSS